jgi:hypothetical protein
MSCYVNNSPIRALPIGEHAASALLATRRRRVSYIVIKVIKGRRYRYEQRSYRDSGRVRTESRYLGPAEGSISGTASPPRRRRKGLLGKLGELIAANTLSPEEKARVIDEAALLKEVKAQEAAREKARADFEAKTGMRLGPPNPTPIEKTAPAIDHARLAAPPATESTDIPAPATDTQAPVEGPAGDAAGPEGSE